MINRLKQKDFMSFLDKLLDSIKSTPTRKAAWQEYPDAKTSDGACIADELINRGNRRWITNQLTNIFTLKPITAETKI